MGRVDGKVVIVTGGAMGLGRAASILLGGEGAAVIVTDIVDDKGAATVAEILGRGGTAEYRHMDVTAEDDIRNVCAGVAERYGRIDALVNNAGISGALKPTHEITVAEWNQVMDVDARGVFLCTKYAIPFMKKPGGSIINISSVYGIVGGIDRPPPFLYHAAKGAVRLMTKSDALCYAGDGIRVNSIHPGWIWTPMLDEVGRKSAEGQEEFNRRLLEHIPLGHYGEPDDVAYAILYFASDESKFITGSELVIDGGYLAR
ncbi:MAG TPA: glucose 1-dehydrogenase [Acidobacteriota bacterium]|nr:glucose 1-dehydrogenase [Acidobacteriota bacterium]